MRQFIVIGHDVPLDGDFSLDDLPGTAGRLDVLCRCVGAAFLLSHGLREDVRVHLVLRDELTVRFDGATLRNLRPDERNVAGLVRAALGRADEAVGHQAVGTSPGVSVARRDLEAALEPFEGVVVHLDEDGRPVTEIDPPTAAAFVLSDHRNLTDREAALVEAAADVAVSLGPERLHADHAITIAHNFLDTAGYSRY